MSKLTAYLIGGQPVGTVVMSWSDSDLGGNPAFKVEDTVSVGYQDISSILNWDNFGEQATEDCSLIRDEIKVFYDATTFASLSATEKEIVSRWFVASQSERNTVKTLEEQAEDAEFLTECIGALIKENISQDILNYDTGTASFVTTYKKGSGLVSSVNGLTGDISLTGNDIEIDETNFSFYPLIVRGNELISGGVSWIDNLDFWVSDLTYTIGGQVYSTNGVTKTLNTAHPTLDRIDVFAADIDNNVIVIEGDPSSNPIKPDVDEFSQVEVSFVTVPAGQTEPDIIQEMIFDENIGFPGEWNPTYSSEFIIDTESYSGSVGVHLLGATAGANIYFGLTQAKTINVDVFQLFIKSKATWEHNYVRGALYSGGERLSKWVRIEDGFQGFNSSNTTDWQVVSLRRASISLQGNLVDELRFEIGGTGSGIGFYLDRVNYQYGIGSEKNELVTIGDLESGLIGAFGAYSMFGNTTETPNPGVSTPSKVAGVTVLEELTTGFESDGVSNRLKFTEPDTRTFEVECNFSAQAAFSNNTYQFYLYKNGTEIIDTSRITVDFVSGGNSQTIVLGDYVELSQGDYVELWCQNDTSGAASKTITVGSLNTRIKKIN